MADFPGVTNDWDLEAIIRGWGGGGSGACAVVQLQQPPPPLPPPVLGFDGFGFGLDESETAGGGISHELKEIYKPFVAQMEQPKIESPRSSQTETTTRTNTTLPCSSSLALIGLEDEAEEPKEVEMKEPVDLDAQDHGQARYPCKRRKSKQRIVRVVHRDAEEDGVAMDKWNWRKYGQKVIKGSPYPRSYYRCSSSGGCHARKHVEQSKDNSQSFIVTYIADHAHPPPTRRHAQAGRRITKFASCSAVTATNNTISTDHKTASASVTWTISDPSILVQDTGGSNSTDFVDSSGLEVFSTTASFDHDFNSWGFDPFFIST